VEHYLESYVDHFNLRHRFHLNTRVKQIVREDKLGKWRLDFEGHPSQHFDKVVLATGPHIIPTMPKFEGAHLFEGDIIHSKSFKR
jgi:dimethylaniline monooxygenase (N-oxide forming)